MSVSAALKGKRSATRSCASRAGSIAMLAGPSVPVVPVVVSRRRREPPGYGPLDGDGRCSVYCRTAKLPVAVLARLRHAVAVLHRRPLRSRTCRPSADPAERSVRAGQAEVWARRVLAEKGSWRTACAACTSTHSADRRPTRKCAFVPPIWKGARFATLGRSGSRAIQYQGILLRKLDVSPNRKARDSGPSLAARDFQMTVPANWQNPITELPGHLQVNVNPLSLLPSRHDLSKVRLDMQQALLDAGLERHTAIEVTPDGVIWDGHHAAVRGCRKRDARHGQGCKCESEPNSIVHRGFTCELILCNVHLKSLRSSGEICAAC